MFSIFIKELNSDCVAIKGKHPDKKKMKGASNACVFSLIFKFYPYYLSLKHFERVQETKWATIIHHQAFWLLSQEHAPGKELPL